MSGRPNAADVDKYIEQMDAFQKASAKAIELSRDIDRYEADLEKVKQSIQKAQAEMAEAMMRMDLHAPGNTGYHERLQEFLLLLGSRVRERVQDKSPEKKYEMSGE